MTRPASPALLAAVALVRGGMSAYAAARQVGIALSTIYRSAAYKAARDARANNK